MKKFTYRAIDTEGRNISADVEAMTVADASKLLQERNLFPVAITEKGGVGELSFSGVTNRLKRIKAKDRVIFTRQLATLIKSGLTITKSLDLLLEQLEHPKLIEVTQDIINKVRGGGALADALAQHPQVFSQIYVSIVEAGEASGTLDQSLLRLAEQEEKTYQINSKIRGAFMYPAIVLLVLILVSILMVVMVLPQVGAMYTELNQPMPLMTRVLLAISNFMRSFWYITGPVFFGMIGGAIYYFRSVNSKPVRDKLKLNIPGFKVLIRKLYMARFARTLSTLVNSGVPVLAALEIVEHVMNNMYYEQALTKISERVRAGEPLSKPILANTELFLPLLGQMLEVGEQTGGIAETLDRVSKYYEEDVDQSISTIQTLIEPATIVVLGLMVIFLVAAVLFPIYNLVSTIR